VGGEREPWLPGYLVNIVEGNAMEAREHRLQALRGVEAGALPGKSLVVYEPASGFVNDVLPCADGHAQERSLCAAVLGTVRAGDLWMADRNCCTRAFLCTRDARGASLVIRGPRGLP
jgi:Transposase DDE domain